MTDCRVLVVDDDPSMLSLISEFLRSEGYAASTAKNGEEAVRLASCSPPNLILLDWLLPGLRGDMVVSALRARSVRTPIVAMTALSRDSDLAEGANVDGYLSKPFDLVELLEIVERFCRVPHPGMNN